MTTDNRSPEPSELPAGSALPSLGRRRLFQGVAGSAGVLLSVQAKTALGNGVCQSPSGRMSGNQSQRPGTGVVCKPGDHPNVWSAPGTSFAFSQWPAGLAKPAFKSNTQQRMVFAPSRPTGYRDIAVTDLDNEGALLSSIVPGAPAVGLWRAMASETAAAGSNRPLLAYLSAACLNSLKYTDPATGRFPIEASELKRMVLASLSGQFYCPSSMSNCSTLGWSPAQVLEYLQSLMGVGGITGAYMPITGSA